MFLCHSLNWSSLYFIEPIILFHSVFALSSFITVFLSFSARFTSRYVFTALSIPLPWSPLKYCPLEFLASPSFSTVPIQVVSQVWLSFFFQSAWILMSLNTGSTECHRHRQWIITLYYLLQEREILSLIFSLLIWIKHSLDIRLFYLFDLSSCRQ